MDTGGKEGVYYGSPSSGHCFPQNIGVDILILCPSNLINPLPSPLPHLLLAYPLQPYWTSCCSLNLQECSLPQGLCIGCSLCLSCSSPRGPHDLSSHLSKTLFKWHFLNCPILIIQFKIATSLAYPISLACSFFPLLKNSSYPLILTLLSYCL